MTIRQPNEAEHAEQKLPQPELELPKSELSQEQSAPAISFKVTQRELFKRRQWKVSILPELVEFTTLDDFGVVDHKEHISITKEEATNRLELVSVLSGYVVKLNHAGKKYLFDGWSKDLNKLRSWVPEKKIPAVQKIEVVLPSEESRIFDSTSELRGAILKGEVSKSLMARIVQYKKDNPKPQQWSTVEKIAVAHADLRSLYRPVWYYSLKYLAYGTIVCFVLKAIDTTVTLFAADEKTGIVWLVVLGSLLFAKQWPLAPILAMFISFNLRVTVNLFITFLATVLVGFLFGAPLGMVVGTTVGHFKRTKAVKAPDADHEGPRPYVLGIIAPIVFLAVLIPLYYWFNIKMLNWIQK